MNQRKTVGMAVVTESAAHGVLRRGSPARLAAEEERTLRMRLGASLPRGAALTRLATATEAEIEVLAYEIEAWMVLRDGRAPRPTPTPAPIASRAKEKIVRALRKKL